MTVSGAWFATGFVLIFTALAFATVGTGVIHGAKRSGRRLYGVVICACGGALFISAMAAYVAAAWTGVTE